MKRKKILGYILFTIAALLIVFSMKSTFINIMTKYLGDRVNTTVTKIPSQCDKYNFINVVLNGKEYEVSISRKDCTAGLYKVGQNAELLMYRNNDVLVWPDSYPELLVGLYLFLGIIVFLKVRKHKGSKNSKT